MTRRLGWLLVAVVLIVTAGPKLQRYLTPPLSLERRSEAAVNQLATQQGWHFEGWRSLTSDGAFRAAVFGRAGCPSGLSVVVLANGPEMATLTAHSLGPDMAFVDQRGRPDSLPLIAVAPRPPVSARRGAGAECAGPSAAAWGELRPTPAVKGPGERVATWLWHQILPAG